MQQAILPSNRKVEIDRSARIVYMYNIDGSYRTSISFDDIIRLDGLITPEVLPEGICGCPPKEDKNK